MRQSRRTLLVLSGGHPYEAGPFDDLLRSLGDWDITHLIHPDGGEADAADAICATEALLFYDMAGYSFGEGRVEMRPPSAAFREALSTRFESGRGAVAMHHALAGWALWPEWHDWLGGQFHYQPGAHGPDSGYRHDVAYDARIVADHPVTRGLPASFPVTDELYLCPIDEAAFTPLVRARGFAFTRDNFYSAANAVAGAMFSNEGWDHPAGSDCIAWESRTCPAPLVYLQFGDGPATYANPHVRRMLAQALDYTSGGTA
ncbi:ThuA domain-containing protein [Erythrobacter sp. sf7]|uniref:ThuA domain-containing protein n=1 Tax=Erythrobacter fulvus TaxID=2987523 RepID=A0ABT5JMB5_9SPHN|nr:ThuA domain-containing protein [Erythrobacter fulvus]MDC8753890.1 ThuA domain-containing protein [Erythrobacter fulvus]